MPARLIAPLAVGLALLAGAASAGDLDEAFAADSLIIVASARACHRFDVYLALDDAQRRRGLMHVRKLPARSGMLFVYGNDGRRSMWMKNTYIPLDILFIRADGSVASVAHDTEPLSLRSVASTEPVRYVLELNAGTAERLAIDAASYLDWQPVRD